MFRRYIYDLPSWVPDWSDHRPFKSWRLYCLSERQSLTKLFNTCHQNSQTCPKFPSQVSLCLQGVFCDQIAQLSPATIFKSNFVQSGVFQNWRKMLNIDKEPEQPYISESTIFDAYWRTLCINTDPITSYTALPKKADGNTRALHDSWWWQVLLQEKYRRVPVQTRKHDEPLIKVFRSSIGVIEYRGNSTSF